MFEHFVVNLFFVGMTKSISVFDTVTVVIYLLNSKIMFIHLLLTERFLS
jgi:hypothetical protein